MWVSKKKYAALEKRIADLEVQVQSQQQSLDYTGLLKISGDLVNVQTLVADQLTTQN